MIVQEIRETGCSARGNHQIRLVGEVFEMPDANPSKNQATFFRLIDGHIGVRVGQMRYACIEHPLLDLVRENLATRPFGGGE